MTESARESVTRLLEYQMENETEVSALFNTLILTGRPNTIVSQIGTKRLETLQDQRNDLNSYPSNDHATPG